MKVRIIRLAIGRLREELVVADVDMEAAVHAGTFCHDSCQMHGVEIPDALIAATARIHGLKLVTRTSDILPMLDDVLVPYRLN